jgi:hypothetical protein
LIELPLNPSEPPIQMIKLLTQTVKPLTQTVKPLTQTVTPPIQTVKPPIQTVKAKVEVGALFSEMVIDGGKPLLYTRLQFFEACVYLVEAFVDLSKSLVDSFERGFCHERATSRSLPSSV